MEIRALFLMVISCAGGKTEAFLSDFIFFRGLSLFDSPQERRVRLSRGELNLQRTDAKGIFNINVGGACKMCTKNTYSDSEGHDTATKFVIREAEERDLGTAANILADAFPIEGRNFLSQRLERMNIYLSLKSRFETFRFADRSGALQSMLVALDADEVVAFCEVDNRPPGGEINPSPRPYISNLAVQDGFRRMGIATDLIGESEQIVKGWGEKRLHLCVDHSNAPAKSLYENRCGYTEIPSRRYTNNKGETILLLSKTL